MIHRSRMRRCRRGFAILEPFLVALIFLAVGLALTFLVRWLLGTTHWATWVPAAVLGIPFLLVYGILVPLILYGAARERFRQKAK